PAARPDAADADDLPGHVAELELLEQGPAVSFQRAPVLGDQAAELLLDGGPVRFPGHQLIDRNQQRRVRNDPWPAVHDPGQLGYFLHAVPGPGLGQAFLHHFALSRLKLGFELRPQLVHVRVRVPHILVAHPGEVAHRLPVTGDSGRDYIPALFAWEPVAARRDFEAGRVGEEGRSRWSPYH